MQLHAHFVINASHLVLLELCYDNSARRGASYVGYGRTMLAVQRTAGKGHWFSRVDSRKGDGRSVLEMDIGEQTERMGDRGWCSETAVY